MTGLPEDLAGKRALRALLARDGARFGFTTAAIETFVAQARCMRFRAGERIGRPEEPNELVNLLVEGAVKVVAVTRPGIRVGVHLVRPGHFFGAGPFFSSGAPSGAVAHVDSVVAMVSREVMANVVAGLPPGQALRLMAFSWRVLSRLLYDKCLLLTMPLRDRVLHELEMLAREFGREEPSGVVIDLPLTHADLAEIVVGTRANVSRCVGTLRRAGRITMRGGRIVLLGRTAPDA
jgi:CRP/FNR family transcriptional regulator